MGKRKVTPEMEQQFISLYNDGFSSYYIAEKFNVGAAAVCVYLKKAGIVLHGNKPSVETESKVVELYRSGMSEEKVGKACNLCRTTVRNILRKYKEPIRPFSESNRKYKLNEQYFHELTRPNQFWILGLLYADGNVSKSDNTIQIGLQSRDLDALVKIKMEWQTDRPLVFDNRSSRNPKHQDMYLLSIDSETMKNDLARYGVVPQKTHILRYPDFIKDEEMHRHFLRGVMDGDGCIHQGKTGNHRCRSIDICGTYDFCIGAKNVIESYLNIHCTVIKTAKNRTTYKTIISGINNSSVFLNWIYLNAELYLERKYWLYKELYSNIA